VEVAGVITPRWLGLLRQELVEITREPAASMWPPPPGSGAPSFNYRVEHVKQVERQAIRLLRSVPADEEVVLAAVWTHDRFQPLFRGEDHGPRAAAWARTELAARGFPAGKVAAVCAAVERHSERPGALEGASVEARLVWDADKLAHLGAFEIVLLVMNNLAADRAALREGDPAHAPAEGTLAWIMAHSLRSLGEGDDSYPLSFYFPESRLRARRQMETQRALL
jgi:hypothetical protein